MNEQVRNYTTQMWSKTKPTTKFNPMAIFVPDSNFVFDEDITERAFTAVENALVKGVNISTKRKCKNLKYDNSWICINGNFFCIAEILVDKNNVVYIAGQPLIHENVGYNLFTYNLTETIRVMKVISHIEQCVNCEIKCNGNTISFLSKCKYRSQID